MKKSILIIDDEKAQVDNLERYLSSTLDDEYYIFTAYEEDDILDKVENSYYSLAILDLRMDDYDIDGVTVDDLDELLGGSSNQLEGLIYKE